ncbi:MAG: RnfABCDGE type electron transport complex subunit D [Candidatus Eisenbacteria bacterium]|nr:RnfABCDGE type electron transport complex subunit D [Candidatus Eisenbacteria bacterium]
MSSSPHVHSPEEVPGAMRAVVYALIPAALAGIWFFGINGVRVIALSMIGCAFFEWGWQRLLKKPSSVGDWSALVTGLLLAMNLPATTPSWMVLLGALVAIVLAKQIYGGLGYNPFNPALVARVFLLISFPVQLTNWALPGGASGWFTVDAATGATPLGAIKEAISLGTPLSELNLAPLTDLFIGNRSGSLGEVSVLFLALGGLYLVWRKIISWHIPASFILTVFVFTGIAHWASPERYAPPMFHVLTGGLWIGAVFMATDWVSSPVTKKGMLIFGFGCGLLTAVIRLWGGYPEGVSFAILLMNAAVPLIDRYTKPRVFGTRKTYEEAKAA